MEYMVSIPPKNLIAKGEKIIFTSGSSEMKMSYEEVGEFPHLLNVILKFVGDNPINIKIKF